MRTRVRMLIAVFVASAGLASAWHDTPRVRATQAGYDLNLYSGLRWRLLGPFRGGRRRGQRRARTSARVLLRLGQRRRVEDD